jgi:hypothetical protein
MGLLESQQGSGPDTPFCAAVDGAFEIICLPNGFVKKKYSIYPRTAKINGENDEHPSNSGVSKSSGICFFCFLSQ